METAPESASEPVPELPVAELAGPEPVSEVPEPVSDLAPDPQAAPAGVSALDLDAVQAELADVEVALARLEAGTYRIDEVTGEELPDELLATDPTARRRPPA